MSSRKGINPGKRKVFRMSEEHRLKIQNSNILNALIEHVQGEREMSSTQVTAGIALMRKVLPDLSATEITGADGGPIQTEDVTARADAFTRQISGLIAGAGAGRTAGKPH